MAELIKNGAIVANEWKTLRLAEGETPETARLPHGNVLVPLAVWQVRKWDLIQRQWHGLDAPASLGVWLAPQDDPALFAADLDDLDVIAIHFPATGDGRGYSLATLLRRRYGYRGELRAIGAVERDHLYLLSRVGFDAFEVADPDQAIAGLAGGSLSYQGALAGGVR